MPPVLVALPARPAGERDAHQFGRPEHPIAQVEVGAAVGVRRVEALVAQEGDEAAVAGDRDFARTELRSGGLVAVGEDGDALDRVGDAVVDEDVLVAVRVLAGGQQVGRAAGEDDELPVVGDGRAGKESRSGSRRRRRRSRSSVVPVCESCTKSRPRSSRRRRRGRAGWSHRSRKRRSGRRPRSGTRCTSGCSPCRRRRPR